MSLLKSLLLAAVLLVASPGLAQHDHDHGNGEPGEMDPEMQAFLEMAEPGAEHAFLKKLEGSWKAEGRFWMAPDAPPSETEGASRNRLILGGRFLQSEYEGASPFGGEFNGIAIDGFDRITKKYVGMWIDTMQTMILSFEGSVDATGKVRTMVAEFANPMGGTAKMKGVTTILSDTQYKYEGFDIGPEGERKSMEILYTRQ